jgi:hypothetical protein
MFEVTPGWNQRIALPMCAIHWVPKGQKPLKVVNEVMWSRGIWPPLESRSLIGQNSASKRAGRYSFLPTENSIKRVVPAMFCCGQKSSRCHGRGRGCRSRPRPARAVTKGASKEPIAVETLGSLASNIMADDRFRAARMHLPGRIDEFSFIDCKTHALTKMFSPGRYNKFQPEDAGPL